MLCIWSTECRQRVENVQVAKLIVALGENEAGKMAILKAIAERHGVVDKEALRKLASGEDSDEERLRVPGHLRGAMCEIGLHCAIAPINVMETPETKAILMANEEWNDLEFEVALDPGAVIHVCSPSGCPGYVLEESSLNFVTARATTSGASSRSQPLHGP